MEKSICLLAGVPKLLNSTSLVQQSGNSSSVRFCLLPYTHTQPTFLFIIAPREESEIQMILITQTDEKWQNRGISSRCLTLESVISNKGAIRRIVLFGLQEDLVRYRLQSSVLETNRVHQLRHTF